MNWFIAVAVCVFVPRAHCATASVAWCYNTPSCNDTAWPSIAAPFCNGTRQSPINIVSANATADANLTAFTFTNYDSTSALTKIENTGNTVKVTFADGVKVSGGDLSEAYDGLQFHLHWGDGSNTPGSEHTVDGKSYPMELHIVNSKASYNKNTTLALADSTGLSALGFFIDVLSDTSAQPASWNTLTSYLKNITEKGTTVSMAAGISLDDLLVGVDRTKYYRYLGSLTTPNCDEAVVWTVFKDPILISKDLIDLFASTVRLGNSTSSLMTNVYRGIQQDLPVRTQPASSATSHTLSLTSLILLLGRFML